MTKLFLLAGEPSGDALGQALIRGLKSESHQLELRGVAGPLMQAEGMGSLFPMDELSVMGIAEVLPKYRHLKRRIRETAEAVLADPPDALVTIDSPDFSLRVARLVKAARPDLPTIHYVAPTVWAWRPGRAQKMAKVIDHVMALFPFEPPYMQAAGMSCDFVGHPVAVAPQASGDDAQAFRARHGLGAAPVVLVLPGSRKGEVARLSEVFGETLRLARQSMPRLRPVIVAAPNVAEDVARLTANWPAAPVVVNAASDGDAAKRAAFRAADVALAASGTVSLELAAAGTPMVIAYDMNWLSRQLIRRMLTIDTVTLVNLVSETRAVPEFLGHDCRAELIAPALLEVIGKPGGQADAMQVTMTRLGQGGDAPGLRAARSILAFLG